MFAAKVVQEELDHQAHIGAALAQRRQVQFEYAQPVVQILAEAAFAHIGLQVLVRSGDDAHVDTHRVGAADRNEGMPFQNAQQFRLAFERQLAHFIEKERSQVGLLEVTNVIAIGAGE